VPSTVRSPARAPTDRRFSAVITATAAAALAGRVVATVVLAKPIAGDPAYFVGQGRFIAHGHWFIDPYFSAVVHHDVASAAHPPLFSLYFALVARLGFESATDARLAAAVLGAFAVAAIGYAGRAVANARVGVIAAVVAAIYPYLWSTDLLVLSETLLALVAALLIVTSYRALDDPSPRRVVWVGLCIAAATLTRAESLLLLPLLGLPLAWRGPGGRMRVTRLVALVVASLVPLAPWVAYNAGRFDKPVYLSTGAGGTLADANCDEVYFGEHIGWWAISCIPDLPGDESVRDEKLRRIAFDYMREHRGDVPRVVAARVGRVWEVFRPYQTAGFDWNEGRGRAVGEWALLSHLVALALAAAGVVVLWRRRRPVLPLVAIVATVTITAAAFYGAVRFRIPADVVLVVLAAVTIDQIATTVTAARTASMGSAVMRNR
jgi:4-amino-4-deoxy-L-arabinose transferase-like glycosyltransferase